MTKYARRQKAGTLSIDATGFTGPVQIDVYNRKERSFNVYATTNVIALRYLADNLILKNRLDMHLIFWFMSNQKGYEPYWGTQTALAEQLKVTPIRISEALKRLAQLNLVEKTNNGNGHNGYRLNPSLYFHGTSSDCTKAIYDWCDRNNVMPLPGCFSEKKIAEMLKRRGVAAANVHAFETPKEAA